MLFKPEKARPAAKPTRKRSDGLLRNAICQTSGGRFALESATVACGMVWSSRSSTWKWIALTTKTGGQPTYYYLYQHSRPAVRAESESKFKGWWTYMWEGKAYPRAVPRGAVHSAEIEYAMGTLGGNDVYAWTPKDYEMSSTLQSYFVNFIKTGDPNGGRLPTWPKYGG
jgi:para-nitrobenzyl esterase